MRKLVIAVLILSSALAVAQRAIEHKVTVSAKIADVWRAWTTSEGAREFFAPGAHIELRPKGAYEILFNAVAPIGDQGSEGCEVLSYIPEKMLSFSWNAPPQFPSVRYGRPTFVVIELKDLGESKTEVTLTHAGWSKGAAYDAAYAYFDEAWVGVMENLKSRFTAGPAKWPDAKPNLEEPPMGPALQAMSNFVGGKWVAEGEFPIEFTYEWVGDRKGLRSVGYIGKGRTDEVEVNARFGWDPHTKQAYYLDSHGSRTVYFGHMWMEGKDIAFGFGPVGGDIGAFSARGRFTDKDTYVSVILDSNGKEQVAFTLKRH